MQYVEKQIKKVIVKISDLYPLEGKTKKKRTNMHAKTYYDALQQINVPQIHAKMVQRVSAGTQAQDTSATAEPGGWVKTVTKEQVRYYSLCQEKENENITGGFNTKVYQ